MTASGSRRVLAAARVRRVGVAALAALALVLTACAGGVGDAGGDAGAGADGEAHAGGTSGAAPRVPLSELTPLADPTSYEGPSTATLVDAAIEPVAENP